MTSYLGMKVPCPFQPCLWHTTLSHIRWGLYKQSVIDYMFYSYYFSILSGWFPGMHINVQINWISKSFLQNLEHNLLANTAHNHKHFPTVNTSIHHFLIFFHHTFQKYILSVWLENFQVGAKIKLLSTNVIFLL